MDLSNLKIVKKLGAGMFGTTYLVLLQDKYYALKMQHISSKSKIKSYKVDFWRELDLYQYINKLKLEQQTFFMFIDLLFH
jgi:serine/threonine protein kinase